MKKEVLLSLLMTTPVAFPALALDLSNLTLPGNGGVNWTPQSDGFVAGYEVNGDGMTCPVGIKSITRNFSLPQGTYKISLDAAAENCNLAVTGDSNVEVIVTRRVVTGFIVKSGTETKVTVTITPKNEKKDNKGNVIEEPFSFNKLNLELDFNWATATGNITTAYNRAKFNELKPVDTEKTCENSFTHESVTVKNTSDKVVELSNAKTALETKIAAIDKDIEALETKSLENYKKYELYKENNKVLASIASVKGEADTYKEAVKAENTRFGNYAVNTVDKSAQLEKQLAYVGLIQELNEDIAAILADKNNPNYNYVVSENYEKRGKDLAALLAPYKTLVESTYADDKMESKIDTKALVAAWKTIDNEYELLNGRINGASADLTAYDQFKAPGADGGSDLFLALRKSYQELVISLAENKNVDDKGKPLPYPANAFAEKINEINNTFEPLYRAAAAYVDVEQDKNGVDYATLKEIGGAADYEKDGKPVKGNASLAIAAINAAQKAVNDANTAWDKWVDDQKAEMATAYTAVNNATDAAKAVAKAINVPSQLQGEVDAALKKVTDAIADVKADIDAAYGKNLKPSVYSAAFASNGPVSKAHSDLITLSGKAYEITRQHTRLTDLKKSIKGISFLEGLYAGDIKAIDDAFAALTKIDDKKTAAAVDPDNGTITKLLDNLLNASDGLVKAYKAADVKADYDKFTKYVDSEKKILPGAEGVRTSTYKSNEALTKKVNDINKKLQEVVANHEDGKVMQTYAAIKKIGDEDAVGVKDQIVSARNNFTVAASQANHKVVSDKLAALKAELAAAETQGNEKTADADKKIADLEVKLATLLSSINASGTPKEADYNKYDNTLQTNLNTDIPAIEKIVEKTLANYRAKKALDAKYAELETALGNAANINAQLSKSPALEYYEGVIGTQQNNKGYWKTANNYNKQISEAYNAAKVSENAAAIKDATLSSMEGTIATVKALGEQIRANEAAHDAQLAAADRVNKLLQEVQAELNKANADGNNGSFTPEAISAKVKEVSEEMLKLNREVLTEYGNGASVDLTNVVVPKFEAQEAIAQELLNSFSATYSAAIAEENGKRLADKKYADGTSSWNQISAALTSEYDSSIASYIKHAYQLTNAGYKAYIAENGGMQTPIEDLYGLQPQIATKKNVVEDPVKGILAVANKEGKLLTKEALADAVADANDLLAKIKNVGNSANAEADAFAAGYWNIIKGQLDVNTANHTALKNAGIVDKFITVKVNGKDTKVAVVTVATDEMKDEDAAVLAAKKLYYKNATDSKKPNYLVVVDHLGLVMDDIANYLDQVEELSDARKEAIAKKMWSVSYDKTVAELSKRISAVDTFTGATADDRAAAKKTMNEAMGKISGLNGEVAKLTSVFAGLNAKLGAEADATTATTLAGYWNKANAAYDVVKAAHDKATATAKLHDEYTKLLDAAKADFAALESFGNTLAGSYGTLNSIATTIENISAQIEAKDYVKDTDTTIKQDISTLKNTTIPGAYKQLLLDQYGKLAGQINNLEAVWAEASKSEYNVPQATLDSYRTQINNLRTQIISPELTDKIDDIAYDYETVAEQTEAYKALGKEMRETETTLSKIEDELKALWNNNTGAAAMAKAELTEAYNKVLADINSLDNYEPETQEAFADQFAGFKAELDKIADDWTAAGVNVVMQKDNFASRIADVAADVAKTKPAVEKKDAAVKAHKAAYKKLSEAYDGQVDILNDIKNLVEVNDIFFAEKQREENGQPVVDAQGNPVMYKPAKEAFEAKIEKLEARLANTKADLDKQNASGSMTADSKLAGFETSTLEPGKGDIPAETETIPAAVNTLRNGVNGVVYTVAGADGNVNVKNVMSKQLTDIYNAIKVANILPDVKADILAQYADLAEKANKALDKTQLTQGNNETIEKFDARKLAQAEKNITAARGIIEDAQALKATGDENTFKRGDVNLDGATDVFDVQTVITLVGERTSYDEFVAANGEKGRVMAAAADMDDDQTFTSADISRVVNESLEVPTQARIAMSRGAVEGANIVAASFVSEEAGVRRYAVTIDNTAAFTTGQLDIKLGDGMTLVDVVAADRAASHEVALFHHGVDSKRVVLFNMDNAVIEGQNGAVVYVDVIGDGAVTVEEAIFADRNFINYRLTKPEGTSGIEDTVIDNNGGLKQRIYNAAGQALRGLQRGVNIIRNSDGSVSKEYHK